MNGRIHAPEGPELSIRFKLIQMRAFAPSRIKRPAEAGLFRIRSAPPNGLGRSLEVEVEADFADVDVGAPLVVVLGLQRQVVRNREFGAHAQWDERTGA